MAFSYKALVFLGCVLAAEAFGPSAPQLLSRPSARQQSSAPLSWKAQASQDPAPRRNVLKYAAALAGGLVLDQTGLIAPAQAALEPRPPTPDDQLMYVGAGCFWHVQHEMIVAEQKILGRSPSQYTSVAGYAGGLKAGAEGKVCYHNLLGDSDYGKLGHTEVVAIKVPEDRIQYFCEAYLNLFNSKGIRADPQDAGGEYRSALGVPGGMSNPVVDVVAEYAGFKGMQVEEGKGNEPDSLKQRLIYVYDSDQFPFYPAEFYHQYHNDFQDKPYGREYNDLRFKAQDRGTLSISKCPGDKKLI